MVRMFRVVADIGSIQVFKHQARQWSTIGVATARHGFESGVTRLMRPVDLVVDPWPLLRKRSSASQQFAIRMVVHGRSGGLVPECLSSFIDDLQSKR